MTDFKEGDKLSHGYNYISNEMKKAMKAFKSVKLILLAGRPGSGMTALAVEMVEYLVSEEK